MKKLTSARLAISAEDATALTATTVYWMNTAPATKSAMETIVNATNNAQLGTSAILVRAAARVFAQLTSSAPTSQAATSGNSVCNTFVFPMVPVITMQIVPVVRPVEINIVLHRMFVKQLRIVANVRFARSEDVCLMAFARIPTSARELAKSAEAVTVPPRPSASLTPCAVIRRSARHKSASGISTASIAINATRKKEKHVAIADALLTTCAQSRKIALSARSAPAATVCEMPHAWRALNVTRMSSVSKASVLPTILAPRTQIVHLTRLAIPEHVNSLIIQCARMTPTASPRNFALSFRPSVYVSPGNEMIE